MVSPLNEDAGIDSKSWKNLQVSHEVRWGNSLEASAMAVVYSKFTYNCQPNSCSAIVSSTDKATLTMADIEQSFQYITINPLCTTAI